jgi:multidrug efflux pump subunit AcrA (membrane-fusion protein)
MKRAFILLTIFGLYGCSPKPEPAALEKAESKGIELYQKGKGLLLPEKMKSMFGLELAEVAEKPMGRYLTGTAQVYRRAEADRAALATVLISADEAKELSEGQAVRLMGKKGEAAELTGKLVKLDTRAESYLGQTEALIEIADKAHALVEGDVLTATLTIREPKPVVAAPQSAILGCAEGSFVYVVNGEHLTRTAVKTGTRSDGWVEIIDGLYSGDVVAIKALERLWFIELSALKGGTPCCPVPKKEGAK